MPQYPGILAAAGSSQAVTYQPNAVISDGVNDGLSRQSAYAGAADSGLWTGAFAFKLNGLDKFQYIYTGRTSGANVRYAVVVTDTNVLRLFGRNSSASTILQIESSVLTTGVWYRVLFSVDMSDTNKRHFYINDVSDIDSVVAYTSGSIDFTVPENYVFTSPSGFNILDGEGADLWGDFGRYVDFDVEANRRKFFNSSNCLVDKGADGSTPFGAAPILYLGDDNTASNWHVNNGTGGDLTQDGALADSVNPPCGA